METVTYATLPVPDPSDPLWDEVVQRPDTARRSLDGTLVVVKWTGPTPAHLPDTATVLTYAECLAVMATPEWSEPIDPLDAP